jgi:hypothetical protein
VRIDPKDAVNEIDDDLRHKSAAENSPSEVHEMMAVVEACLARLAPPRSTYAKRLQTIGRSPSPMSVQRQAHRFNQLIGMLRALRSDYGAGRTRNFEELVHASLFADLLEQAAELSGNGYHQAAVVLAGCTLEEHLRKLAVKHSVPVTMPDGKWKKANVVNADLAKAGAYGKTEQAHVEAHLKDRNEAAHPPDPKAPAVFDRRKVEQLLRFVRDFIGRYPA